MDEYKVRCPVCNATIQWDQQLTTRARCTACGNCACSSCRSPDHAVSADMHEEPLDVRVRRHQRAL